MCECYQIGGRFIAEDPDCPVHGRDNLPSQIERLEAQVERLETQRKELRKALIECLECEFAVTEKSVIAQAVAALKATE